MDQCTSPEPGGGSAVSRHAGSRAGHQWPQIHAEVLKAVGKYSDGENIAFGASVVLASGRK